VWRGESELDLGGPKQRAILALLAASGAAGNPVSRAELIDALWPEHPPASADNVVHTYLKRLRRLLEPDRPPHAPSRFIHRVAGGHVLRRSELELDVMRFRQLVDAATQAARTGDQHRATAQLGKALMLWRGAPLAGVTIVGHHPRVVALANERWAAVAQYGEAMLAIGKPAEALPRLAEAAAACPLDEAAHARLIGAYHASGNRGQAFATYYAVRDRLADELGVDPGPELATAHLTLLRGDRAVNGPAPPSGRRVATAVRAASPPKPAQLPPPTPVFVGRAEALRRLDNLASARASEPGAVVMAIVGTAGAGKTTVAIHWAHRVAERFPDGQIYLNLRGFDPTGRAMSPAEAVRGLLDALHVPTERIPATLDGQVGLYRSLMSGRRMLLVLDNARDADQVRSLLPGTPGCLALGAGGSDCGHRGEDPDDDRDRQVAGELGSRGRPARGCPVREGAGDGGAEREPHQGTHRGDSDRLGADHPYTWPVRKPIARSRPILTMPRTTIRIEPPSSTRK
jgi:DNA-binding SARP family transcriptional activator